MRRLVEKSTSESDEREYKSTAKGLKGGTSGKERDDRRTSERTAGHMFLFVVEVCPLLAVK